MRKSRALPLAVIAAMSITACSGVGAGGTDGSGAGDQEVQLSVVSAFDKSAKLMAGYDIFVEKLAETGPWITLNYRGGSEVMAAAQLGEAIATGGIDMAATAATFDAQAVPLAGGMVLSPLTSAEERDKGAADLLSAAHEKAGIHYVGRMGEGFGYKLYFAKEQDPLKLDGLSIRTSPVYVKLLEALGGSPVAMPPGELFGALERGVVDGYGWTEIDVMSSGWQDVTGFETEAVFYQVDTIIIMSQPKWETLDERSQKAINDAIIATEDELGSTYDELVEEEAKKRAEAGIKVLEMDDAAKDRFIKTANDARWSEILDVSGDDAKKLREIYGN